MIDTTFNTLAIIIGLLALAVILFGIAGCQQLQDLDERLWGDPANPDPDQPSVAPPILEGIAYALAGLGYPGMAFWIHKNRKNGRSAAQALEQRIEKLEAQDKVNLKG